MKLFYCFMFIYYNNCASLSLTRSKTCPKCRKPAQNREMLKVYLDICDANKDKEKRNKLIAELRTETVGYRRKLDITLNLLQDL